MILFYGRSDDPPLTTARQAAAELGLEALLIDQATAAGNDLMVGVENGRVTGRLLSNGITVQLEQVSGVYARPLELPATWSDSLGRLRAQAFNEIFCEWLDMTPARVLNRPAAMEANGSKPYQMQEIAAAGFEVPETLITSDPDEARAFWSEHERAIFKSSSGVRSIVREMDESVNARLDKLRDLPALFQAYVPGDDVRVHVVGGEAFACRIESGAIDYRYASLQGSEATLTAIELPAAIAQACIGLAEALRLPLCGIDLRRTPADHWVCFEVNPMPAYTFFESHAGLPIARAIAELLAS